MNKALFFLVAMYSGAFLYSAEELPAVEILEPYENDRSEREVIHLDEEPTLHRYDVIFLSGSDEDDEHVDEDVIIEDEGPIVLNEKSHLLAHTQFFDDQDILPHIRYAVSSGYNGGRFKDNDRYAQKESFPHAKKLPRLVCENDLLPGKALELGENALDGVEVERNIAAARGLFQSVVWSAADDETKAQAYLQLCLLYAFGLEGKQNVRRARECLDKALSYQLSPALSSQCIFWHFCLTYSDIFDKFLSRYEMAYHYATLRGLGKRICGIVNGHDLPSEEREQLSERYCNTYLICVPNEVPLYREEPSGRKKGRRKRERSLLKKVLRIRDDSPWKL